MTQCQNGQQDPPAVAWPEVFLSHIPFTNRQLAEAAGVGLLYIGLAWWLGSTDAPGQHLQLSFLLGGALGFVLQRSRFCFQCIWRDWLDKGDPDGAYGLLAALAVGLIGYTLIYGAWLPDPSGSRLPPTAHVGPVGPVLILAGLAFGSGMAISGSCISAHLYRLGEGSPASPFALIGAVFGFWLGFASWNLLYLASISESPILWLPRTLGYAGALLGGLAVLGLLALALHWGRTKPPTEKISPLPPAELFLVRRWPGWVGGAAVGLVGIAAYFRLSPLGVTAEIGARARQSADWLGILPARLEGLDAFRGCATIVRDALLTPNGVFIAGLVIAARWGVILSGTGVPFRPRATHVARGLLGGALLGLGAMIGLGCTIGTLLSGISAGAVSGWLFGAFVLAGSAATTRLGRKWGVL